MAKFVLLYYEIYLKKYLCFTYFANSYWTFCMNADLVNKSFRIKDNVIYQTKKIT